MTHTPTILLVDDSPLVHKVYGPPLEAAGFRVLHTSDGIAAINTAMTQQPDVIVLDIYMPKINGYQVCRLLKDHAATKAIPMILITGGEAGRLVADPKRWSFETGADAYIEKGSGDLVAEVRRMLVSAPPSKTRRHPRTPLTEVEIMTALSALLDKQLYHDVSHLQELNEKKSAFVSLVAHELKAPLTVIKGSIDNMGHGTYGGLSASQRACLALVNRTVDRLVRLIRELLDLTRIEAGRIVLQRAPVSLGELLHEVIADYQAEAAARQLIIQHEGLSAEAVVHGDRDRLEQVFINLLTNAIKWTPEGGMITVALSRHAQHLRVTVTDTGIGVGATHHERIFQLFERVDPEDGQGVGLGLPIARTLIELHGGRLWVESDGQHGSTFTVELPRVS